MTTEAKKTDVYISLSLAAIAFFYVFRKYKTAKKIEAVTPQPDTAFPEWTEILGNGGMPTNPAYYFGGGAVGGFNGAPSAGAADDGSSGYSQYIPLFGFVGFAQ